MVKLFLIATKGNSGGRYFPYYGYLGLTPVRVEGAIRTKIEEDGKTLPAKSLTVAVRCYEYRLGKTGVLHSRLLVDYAKVLWRKPDTQDFADFGNFDSTFKITLPKRIPGFSTANYQEYRVCWRIEAVLDHVPFVGVGSRLFRCFDLPLIRYDIPPPLPSPPLPTEPPSSTPHTLYHPTIRPQYPVLRYNLSTPVLPIGPSDFVFTSIHLRPLNPTVSIRSATVLVERRIDLHNVTSNSQTFSIHSSELPPDDIEPPSPSPSRPRSSRASASSSPPIAVSSSMPESSSSVVRRSPYSLPQPFSSSTVDTTSPTPSSSTYTVTSPLLPHISSSHSSHSYPPMNPIDVPSKSLTSIIAYADSGVGGFAVDRSTGVWSKTVSLQWPKPRSHFYWAQGETSKTDLADVTFWVRVKIIVSSPATGTESFDLEPQEITVVSTNDSDRRLALAKFAEQKDMALQRERSKSKSPGRRKTHGGDTDGETPPVPSDDDRKSSSSHRSHRSAAIPPPLPPPPPTAVPQTSTTKKPPAKIKIRRPHTSAGPRDKSNLPYNISAKGDPSGQVTRPGTGVAHQETRGTMATGFGVTRGVDIGNGRTGGNEDVVRAWEEELARIENVSRRSSARMLAFFGWRRRGHRSKEVTAGAG